MANISWIGPAAGSTANKPSTGNWSLASNWSGGLPPTSSDAVTLGGNNSAAAGGYIVTVDTNASVGSLALSATRGVTLDLAAHNLVATTSITIGSGCTINTTGTIGTVILNGGTTGISNTGTIAVTAGTLSIVGSLTDNSGGAVTVTSGTTLTTSGSVTNSSGATITVNGTFTETGTAAITNSGTITLSTGTLQDTNASAVAISNSGTINSSGTSALTDSNGGITNTGTIHVTGGTLTVTGALTDNSGGALTIDSGAVLTTANALTNNFGATITVSGTLTETGTAAISNAGIITLSGGTLQDTHGAGQGGAAAISNSGTINSSGASALTDSNGGITNTGTIHVTGGTLTVTGALTDTSTGALTIDSGAVLTTASALTNNSGATITVSGTLTETGTAAISNSGTITLSGGTLQDTHGVGAAAISNSGTINSSGTSALSDSGGGISNSGNLNVTGGALTVTDVLTDSGTIAMSSGASLTDSSGITLSGGTLSGAGTVTGAIGASGAAHITANGGTLTIANGITDSGSALTLTVTGNSDRLVLNGTGAAHTVSFGGSGTLEIGAAGALTIGTNTSITSGTIQLDGGTLTDSLGLTIGSVATLIGSGTVSGALSGTGIVEAHGGSLHLQSAVTNPLAYRIDTSSTLQLDSTLASNNIVFTFLNAANGGLGLSSDSGLVGANSDSMSGLNVSTGGVRTNFIDIEGHNVTVSSIVHNGTTSGTVTLDDGAVLNLTNIANGSSTWFADTATDGNGGTYVFLSDTVCFMPGTQILTPEGEIEVEALKPGDLVTTADGQSKPIRWVGRQTVSRFFADPLRVLPIRIAQGALGDNMPSRDLLVSPDHALLIDGALIQSGALVNDSSIARETNVPERFTYYHVELVDHSLILAENTPAETFIDNIDRMAFDNWDEHEALLDSAEVQLVEMSYPRAKAYRQVPRATRDRLARRAAALNGLSQVA